MGSTVTRTLSWPLFALALSSPLLMDCGGMPSIPGVPNVPGMPGNCPDMANVEAVAKFDWAHEFKLDGEAAGKLKGGITAAINLQGLAAQIDADLRLACGNLAKDLGDDAEYSDGASACKAAMAKMGEVRGKLGAKAKLDVDIKPPTCGISMDAMAGCAGECDASISGGKAEVHCEGGELSGVCEAECKGSCELSAAASCGGKCEGSCDAKFKGQCGGECDGRCDGKKVKGVCKGTCEGSCDAGASGECKGQCSGSCEFKGEGKCDGTCSGSCSVAMKEPTCTGEIKAPEMSAECKASCDAKLSGNLSCTPAKVVIRVDGAADADAAANYKMAIEKNLPAILKVAVGMKDRVGSVVTSVSGVVDGAQTAVKGAVSGGPLTAAALTACVAAPFKGAIDAVGSIEANVNVSVEINASASGGTG